MAQLEYILRIKQLCLNLIEVSVMEEVDVTAPKAMTDWGNEPTVSDLRSDYDSAKSAHGAQVIKINGWLDNLHVRGAAKPQKVKGRSGVQPALIRKQAEWRYGSLSEPFLSTEELFMVDPVSWEDKEAAIQTAAVLNYQFATKINKVAFIDEYVRAAVDEGTAIVRVGWCSQTEVVKEEVPVYAYYQAETLQDAKSIRDAMALQQQNPNGYKDLPDALQASVEYSIENGGFYVAQPTGTEVVEVEKVIKNHPTVEVVNPDNLVIDPSCNGDLTQAQFVVFSFETSKSDLEKDGRYKNLDKIMVDSANPLSVPDHETIDTSGFNFKDNPRKKFVAYEYWGWWDIDGSGKTKPIVATYVNNVMIRLEENPYPDKQIPFVAVPYLPVRKSVYGEPDGALLEDNQKIVGAATRGMIDLLARSANGQTGIRKGILDVTNRRKFQNGEDYEFNLTDDPRSGIFMHEFPEIPSSAPLMIQYQTMEAESMTGVKSFSQGISGKALGDVAEGVRGALDAASKRELGILRRLANGVIAIGRKFATMNAEFLSDEEVIRITNEEFITVRREDLSGEYDIRLSISTAEVNAQKAQELAFMLQTMGPSMDFSITQMLLADIARLRDMPDLAKKIETYQPQPDPMQQEMAQLQIELLKAQIRAENAKAVEDVATARYKSAQAVNTQSDTDLKNLEYVETESGVTQARDVERIQAQSQAQTQTKVVEHMLDSLLPTANN